MVNRRRNTRKRPSYYMEVLDERTGFSAGALVNLSTDGLQVSSHKPIETDSYFQFGLTISDALAGEHHISVDARSVWCQRNLHTNEFDTGFEMVNVDSETETVISQALSEYLFKN